MLNDQIFLDIAYNNRAIIIIIYNNYNIKLKEEMLSMKIKNPYFKIFPKVVQSDNEATITIEPLFDHVQFKADAKYEILYYPMDKPVQNESINESRVNKVIPENRVIKFTRVFEGEQEHMLILNEISSNGKKTIDKFRIYSVEKDLYERYPYKGDLHIHSNRSDGTESPAYVASSCRKIGLDFMALTDHHRYYPSIEAQEAFKDIDLDFKIFRGEEVHPPENPLHIVNFGGSFSVNELFKDSTKYYNEVNELKDKLGNIPNGVDKFEYASSVWVCNKIREANGLSIFCHPYWIFLPENCKQAYYISSGLISHLFDTKPCDAYELLGGYTLSDTESNTLQVARYHDEISKGKKIPIVGSTDAHSCENGLLFGWYYTIVFSPSSELQDIISNIKNLYSVAVEALPNQKINVYGPFRLVKYALFLIREVLPTHDALCFEEGKLMLDYASKDKSASDKLEKLKGSIPKFMAHCFGR